MHARELIYPPAPQLPPHQGADRLRNPPSPLLGFRVEPGAIPLYLLQLFPPTARLQLQLAPPRAAAALWRDDSFSGQLLTAPTTGSHRHLSTITRPIRGPNLPGEPISRHYSVVNGLVTRVVWPLLSPRDSSRIVKRGSQRGFFKVITVGGNLGLAQSPEFDNGASS